MHPPFQNDRYEVPLHYLHGKFGESRKQSSRE